LQNSVSFDGKVERLAAQVPARRAIDRNQNGPKMGGLTGISGLNGKRCPDFLFSFSFFCTPPLTAYLGIKTNSFEINAEICFH